MVGRSATKGPMRLQPSTRAARFCDEADSLADEAARNQGPCRCRIRFRVSIPPVVALLLGMLERTFEHDEGPGSSNGTIPGGDTEGPPNGGTARCDRSTDRSRRGAAADEQFLLPAQSIMALANAPQEPLRHGPQTL